jgi:hypothetical protein
MLQATSCKLQAASSKSQKLNHKGRKGKAKLNLRKDLRMSLSHPRLTSRAGNYESFTNIRTTNGGKSLTAKHEEGAEKGGNR